MQIIATRKRIGGTQPLYEYRIFVPFSALSAARQDRINYRCDFAQRGEPLARIAEVIAPIDYLRLAPGSAKHAAGLALIVTAKTVEAVLVRALFPEMTAERVPLLFHGRDGLADVRLAAIVDDLTGREAEFAAAGARLTPEALHLVHDVQARAA